MHRTRIIVLAGLFACLVWAHPMGNFSVNHYARILPRDGGADIDYVLDLAEVPTFELLKKWNLQAGSPPEALQNKASEEARGWVGRLDVTLGGAKAEPHLLSTHMTLADGAGGMKTMRVEMKVAVTGGAGKLAYADGNYPEQDGWKEIVVGTGPDRSQALRAYPGDVSARPRDLRYPVEAQGAPARVAAAAPADNTTAAPQTRSDYLSTVLHGGEITFGVALMCLLVTFGLGALHAFEPGHGKTMVAAYLVGSRGTPKHAVLLGLMTTFTHTISVFLLGFVTLFLSRYIMPEKMTRVLGILSGLSIVWIGAMMLYKRSRKLMGGHTHTHVHAHHHHDHGHHHHDEGHSHEGHSHHHHDHDHGHSHAHDHDHGHSHGHDHEHHHEHHHDQGHAHHHMPEGEITTGSLIALGASGGLVPCPAALILLLTCISLGRPAFGIMLLLSFSVGLAMVLMATGLVVLYAKNLLPERHRNADSAFLRAMPVVSAAVIVVIGIVTTGVSLGWIPAMRFLG